MNKEIAKMLNAIIAAKGWTEHEAAEALGISQSAINRLRHRQVKNVSFTVGLKITNMHKALPKAKRAA